MILETLCAFLHGQLCTFVRRGNWGNTDSIPMKIVASQLYISISIILFAYSEVLQVIHSPLYNLRLPWHTSFTIILITKLAPEMNVENG